MVHHNDLSGNTTALDDGSLDTLAHDNIPIVDPSPTGDGTGRLVVLSDFGTGPKPVTDADGLWLYGPYDMELEH